MLADVYSMADYSTTVRGIPIRIAGGFWLDASYTVV